MQIYTRVIQPTDTAGKRIRVWTEWSYGHKISRIYSWSYIARDAHDYCVAVYLKEFPELARKSGIFSDSIIDHMTEPQSLEGYYKADGGPRGYVYTNLPALLEGIDTDEV